MNIDERKLRFEEYKIFRDTITHFDKILINLRKNAIYFSFTIFAAAIAAISFNIPTDLPLKAIDLSIAFIIIELFIVLSFLFLEDHYRYYLLKIAEAATEYEIKLELGIKLEECDCNNKNCDTASVSKCLKCLHDNGMEHHIRAAHFYIYALLLALGFIALNILMFFKIKLSFNESILPLITTVLIALVSPILYVYINIKKQRESSPDKKMNQLKTPIINIFNNNSLFYIFSIFLFMILTYLFYYLSRSFTISYLIALLISVVTFVVLGFRGKISKIISDSDSNRFHLIIPRLFGFVIYKYFFMLLSVFILIALLKLFLLLSPNEPDYKTVVSYGERGTILISTLAVLAFTYAANLKNPEKDSIIMSGKYFLKSLIYFVGGIIFSTGFRDALNNPINMFNIPNILFDFQKSLWIILFLSGFLMLIFSGYFLVIGLQYLSKSLQNKIYYENYD